MVVRSKYVNACGMLRQIRINISGKDEEDDGDCDDDDDDNDYNPIHWNTSPSLQVCVPQGSRF